MLRINPSKQMFGILIGVAVVMLFVFIGIFMSQNTKVGKLQAEVKAKQTKLDDSIIISQRLADVQARYDAARSDLSILEKGVSSKAYVPTLLRQIEELGRGMNLRVVGVRPKAAEVKPAAPKDPASKDKDVPVEKPKPYDEMVLNFEMSGKYWDIVKFLDQITSFPKIIAVQSVEVSPESGQSIELASPELSVKVRATAFILKETNKAPVVRDEAKTLDASAGI